MTLRLLHGTFSIARYPADAQLGPLATREFCSITRTRNELTVVCETDFLPAGIQKREDGWVVLEVEGLLDFDLTGILSAIAGPLAKAEVSIFAVSTFDTDYVLVKRAFLDKARRVLTKAGITVA
ncbi:MAG: ACT domain-containing protein [Bdellovibrionales bacterium]